ncbi:hypothetical protein SAMD00023353_9700260 [Rosellinia necatrix]|uniref:Uncharacterized protein n=1 Tax=Rosellinia necatrix TaxID=77044 RepID=A0A1S8AAY7_ROSNE|nr:hypothetical protein SAMD00023353_9700260 [Rosellinia necatrix]
MAGTRIPLPHPKSRPQHHLASHPSGPAPTAPSVPFPRDGSASSLLSPGDRDSSIRIVKPNLALPPPQKAKSTTTRSTSTHAENDRLTTVHGNKQTELKSPDNTKASQSGFKTMDGSSSSQYHLQSQHQKPPIAPKGHSRNRNRNIDPSVSMSSSGTQGNLSRPGSTDRGRTMQRRYEFLDSDDNPLPTISPAKETVKNNSDIDEAGRESNMTTITDLVQQCGRQADEGVGASSAQPSLHQPKPRRRPPPLDLDDPIHVGMVSRHTNRYEVEHVAIKSSKAEHHNSHSTDTGSSTYDDRIEVRAIIPPVDLPDYKELCNTDPLESYRKWRDNLRPARTSSQGSIHITMPTQGELNPTEGAPIVNRTRSHSALGIRDRQPSDNAAYTPSVYSTVTAPFSRGSGIARSATMNDVSHRVGRQSSGASVSKPTQPTMEATSPLCTPLTPFIMTATGAPAGVERGTKKLFGEHGWLEDTAAASGATKTKMEKAGGFVESLKRKAREIADSTSFKPARTIRTSVVNRINISLDARAQSLLYCELEYNLSNALDAYIQTQLNSGRLEPSKLNRIADAWTQKGRPKVISFRYDLETQINLVMAHINEFRFYGRLQADGLAATAGLLYAMKSNARSMRVRTFCQPDSVIAKHILDSQNLLCLLGCPETTQRPLEEVAQFFKVAVDRRRVMAEAPPACIASDGSAQRVRFQGDGEGHHPYAEAPEGGKSRTDIKSQTSGSANSRHAKPQSVKPWAETRGPSRQRQFSDDTKAAGTYDAARGRSRPPHHE